MMNFASQELNEGRESGNYYDFSSAFSETKPTAKPGSVKLFADKIRVPSIDDQIARPRLLEYLAKSLAQFSATLITGRAGTGKTLLAADFARQNKYRVAWYKVETADTDWNVFANYLLGSLHLTASDALISGADLNESEVSPAAESIAAEFSSAAGNKPLLIVMDDLHSVFDAVWFDEFFNSFVRSLSANIHLLLIARTLPPLPLWRLRSKQILGVMDEKLLTCTLDEASELFHNYHLSPTAARIAHKRTFGRIVKLKEIAEKKSF